MRPVQKNRTSTFEIHVDISGLHPGSLGGSIYATHMVATRSYISQVFIIVNK